MDKPNYYAVLEADVRYDKRLKPMEKLLYAEITALTNMNGKCEAQNAYFAELYDVNKATVSRWISNIAECEYIEVEVVKNNQGRVDKRIITLLTKKSIPSPQKSHEGIDKKVKVINTNPTDSNTNLTDSNTKNKKSFSFSLLKSSQYENLSSDYKDKLYAYAVIKDGAYQFDKFINSHGSNGKGYKNWSMAYNTWVSNAIEYSKGKYTPSEFIRELTDHPMHKKVYKAYFKDYIYTEDLECVGEVKIKVSNTPSIKSDEYSNNIESSAVRALLRSQS